MRIVVVGVGKVGYTLLKELSQEGHDLVAVDREHALLNVCQTKLDVATVAGNGASLEVLREAEVAHADLMIAVTNSDEVNLLCCMAAHKLGCPNVVARVRNPEYNEQIGLMKGDLGLSFTINPEKSAAYEIFHLLQFPSLQKREFFFGGRIEIAEITIPPESQLVNQPLSKIGNTLLYGGIICAIDRRGETIIPHGDTKLQAGDKISISAATREMPQIVNRCGIKSRPINRVLIVGGGRLSAYLAFLLLDFGVRVTIIEESRARCEELCMVMPNLNVICGDGTEQELLLDEGIRDADAVVPLTGIDEENFMVSMFANHLGVSKTITKIDRMEYSDFFLGTGIDTVVNPKLLTANQILSYVRSKTAASREGSVETLCRIADGKTEALGFTVPEGAPYREIPLMKLHLQKRTLIASILRGQEVIIPTGNDCMLPGDSVVVIADPHRTISNLTDIFRDNEGFVK